MKKRVLIIGGYGNFGSYISEALCREKDIQIIIAGRTKEKCEIFAKKINADSFAMDIKEDMSEVLQKIKPDIVINASGPYQEQNYNLAEICIKLRCHYIDLADGRAFVTGISTLDQKAKKAGVVIISGASSVPCLSSAVIDHYIDEFDRLTEIDYAISTAQRTNTGLATAEAVLSYAGKSFETFMNGQTKEVFGWQNLHWYKYPEIGWRPLSNCNIPDLSLFPQIYPDLKTQRFYAGLEVNIVHIGLWLMSWLVRWRLLSSLSKMSEFLLKSVRLFDFLGGYSSGFYMTMRGLGKNGKPYSRTFSLIAKQGHGLYIPSIPATLCTKMLVRGEINNVGAYSCIGIISLKNYLEALKDLDIQSFNHF